MTLAATVIAVMALTGCGSAPSRQAAPVRVGDRALTRQDLAGWMAVIAPEHLVPDPPLFDTCIAGRSPEASEPLRAQFRQECAQQYRSLKTRALSFLIRCEWLVAEAARRAVSVRVQSSGKRRRLKAGGATAHDVDLALEAESAASMLRRLSPERTPKVTRSQALSFYLRHRQRFESSERRYFEIAEGLTRGEAERFLQAARHGAHDTVASPFFAEEFPRSSIATGVGEYKVLREAIFAATPHVLSGPVMLNASFTVFEVTRITPAKLRPFGEVTGAIEKLLEVQRRRQLPAGLLADLRDRWMARTDCQPGYVVSQCRQHTDGSAPEEAFEFE